MAIQVYGNWDIGYVMDRHTSNSEYLGDDAYGHPMFDTTYTELGELVHKLKYKARYDLVEDIINNISEFIVGQFAGKIDCVISVPPTNNRIEQPAFLIAEQIAELLHCSCRNDILENVSTESAKNNPNAVIGSIKKLLVAKRPTHILLVDDIYSTGTTANECVKILKEDPNVLSVSLLAITKTKG